LRGGVRGQLVERLLDRKTLRCVQQTLPHAGDRAADDIERVKRCVIHHAAPRSPYLPALTLDPRPAAFAAASAVSFSKNFSIGKRESGAAGGGGRSLLSLDRRTHSV
jgi:uncharacterized radical SAM superfamily Fe-S cluster-containing enzyme